MPHLEPTVASNADFAVLPHESLFWRNHGISLAVRNSFRRVSISAAESISGRISISGGKSILVGVISDSFVDVFVADGNFFASTFVVADEILAWSTAKTRVRRAFVDVV